ncbi:MarR family winged helix-turn-helix transcriptional regulator [Bacillus altitudinis]|uniref:MarR family winged helix-turn-helix transcriptional regulator n=1 Tax=Bacillus altitudinis TaxID=293387 RepID=UPI000418AF70|nr:winged helix-turn-helix domain-containing protein [Bacillus altitudinis]MDR4199755.1 winged helix-turn-helix transcriptional regulator [Bacillus altitudinis]
MYSDEIKSNFFEMVDSLKKSRRADLSDINDDSRIIEKLYTDPLHNNLIFSTCMKANTTILVGRKGTGKSTIIARLQHEIRKSKDKLSVYLDVKNIYEQSKTYTYNEAEYQGLMHQVDLRKYLVAKSFLSAILKEIKDEVKTNSLRFQLARITKLFGPDKKKFESEIEDIFKSINNDEYKDITVLKNKQLINNTGLEQKDTTLHRIEGSVSAAATNSSFELKAIRENKSENTINDNTQATFAEVLLRHFNPATIIEQIKKLLSKIGIKYVFICLDDFSEIDEDAMKIFVDTIISPLNNWSDEFFKFKISAYPGRYYLGEIDPTKIDQIKLDYYDLYTSTKVTETEREAAENIKRLLEKRSQYFCETHFGHFIDSKQDVDEYYAVLFRASSNVPRNVGWILWYANQNSVSKNRGMNIRDLEVAAERYYVDSIEIFFTQNRYMRESFREKLGKYHLKVLLNEFITGARKNKSEIMASESKIWEKDRTNPPTSHFYINKDNYEDTLQTLELNYFITKYNEQKDQDSRDLMSFYSLNYGLCMKENITYGRGSDRKYVIQRRFNYNKTIEGFLNTAKKIICDNCGITYPIDSLEKLKFYDMLCPRCKIGKCHVEDVEVAIPGEKPDELLLPEIELAALNSLRISQPQYATQLAQELDTTMQKVSKVIDKLEDKELVIRKKENGAAGKRTYYYLTETARELYFLEG